MKKIKTKLIFVFISYLIVLALFSSLFIYLNFTMVDEYRKISDIIVIEQSIIPATEALINDYNSFSKNVNDATLSNKYEESKKYLTNTFEVLDATIIDKKSRVSFIGLKNNVDNIISYCDDGIDKISSGEIAYSSEYYLKAYNKNYYVKTNTADLVLSQIVYSKDIIFRLERSNSIIAITALISFIIIVLISIVFTLVFSERLTRPIAELSRIASKASKGKNIPTVENRFLEREDEIGSLASSFNKMLQDIKDRIKELQNAKRNAVHMMNEIDKSKDEITKKVLQLERFKQATVDTEIHAENMRMENEHLKMKLNSLERKRRKNK